MLAHLRNSLYLQVLVAICIGIALGHFYPSLGVSMKPFGDGFIKLIKMLIGPIIFCTIVSGIANMENMKHAGRVGIKALIYFEILTTFALVIGLALMHLYKPGEGMNIDPATLDARAVETFIKGAHEQPSFKDFLLNLIPNTTTDAFAQGNILQILLFSILFAASLVAMGKKGEPILALVDTLAKAFYGIIAIIMKTAPLGAFGAMAFTVGQYGIGSLGPLFKLLLSFYATCVIFIGVVLGSILRLCRLSLWKYLCYIKEELFIVLGTSSSETVLPRIMEKLERLGCEKPIVGMVIPTGYSFNLDGSCIYFTMAALFLAQATNTPLGFTEEMTLLGVLLLTSKGATGVVGSAFVVLAATLATIGHIPVASLALILGIDRFMAEGRALTNLIGNGIATIVIAKWENAFDETQARAILGMKETVLKANA